MNVYSVLPLIALFANLFLCFFILYINHKNRLNQIYSLIAFFLSVWSIAHFYLFNSTSLLEANFWNNIATTGAVFSGIFMFHFSLAFTTEKISQIKKLFLIISYGIGGFFVFAEFNTNLLTQEMIPSYWGFQETPGPGYIFLSLFLIILVSSSITICYRFYTKNTEYRIKNQAKYIMIGFSIPLVGGVITQVFFPILNIEFLPLTSTLSTISVIIIGISITKYKLMTPMSFSIQKKIVIMFFVFLFVLLFFNLSIINVISTSSMKEKINSDLQAIAQSRANHINHYLNQLENEIELINTGPGYNQLLLTDDQNANYGTIYSRVEKRLTNSLSENYLEIFITNRKGKVIISTDANHIGENKSTEDFFIAGLNQTYIKDVYYSNMTGERFLTLSTPIQDIETNGTIGLMIARVDTKKLDEITTDTTGMGYSGETYLVNRDGYMITPSRFVNNTVLTQKIDSVAIVNSYKNGEFSEESALFEDYRGNLVYGIQVYIPKLQWVLYCEIDESEVMASVNQMQIFLTLVLSGLSVILLLFAWYYSKTLSMPIKELDQYANEIKKGNFDVKANITSGDEIASLSDSFNLMADSLKDYTNTLEQKVDERTLELQEKIKELKKFKKVTVGRELRMAELKKQIKQLQQKDNTGDDQS